LLSYKLRIKMIIKLLNNNEYKGEIIKEDKNKIKLKISFNEIIIINKKHIKEVLKNE